MSSWIRVTRPEKIAKSRSITEVCGYCGYCGGSVKVIACIEDRLIEQAQTGGMMLAVLVIAFVLLLSANWIHRVIGNSGASIVSRVMGLILGSVATANVLSGITEYFHL